MAQNVNLTQVNYALISSAYVGFNSITAGSNNLVLSTSTTGGITQLLIDVTTTPTFASLNLTGALELNGSAGTSGQVLTSAGTGVVPTWQTVTPVAPGGSNTYVQFNNSGAFGGSANLTWNGTTLELGASKNVYVAGLAYPALVMNSAGSEYGYVGNTAANTWALGYNTATTALGSSALTWNSAGAVTIAGALTAGGALTLTAAGVIYTPTGEAVYDTEDGWLRLNNNGSFSNGVYTPGTIRADGGFTSYRGGAVIESIYGVDVSLYGVYGNLTYGSWMAAGANNTYAGYAIDDGTDNPTFMSQGTTFGVYAQGAGFWSWVENGSTFTIAHALSAPSASISGATSTSTLSVTTTNGITCPMSTFNAGTEVVYASSGTYAPIHTLGLPTSSARFKLNIQTLDHSEAGDIVLKLRPVKFTSNPKTALGNPDEYHYGLIAEEVEEILPSLVNKDEEGKPFSVNYRELAPLLLPLVQKLLQRVFDLEAKLEATK